MKRICVTPCFERVCKTVYPKLALHDSFVSVRWQSSAVNYCLDRRCWIWILKYDLQTRKLPHHFTWNLQHCTYELTFCLGMRWDVEDEDKQHQFNEEKADGNVALPSQDCLARIYICLPSLPLPPHPLLSSHHPL